MISPYYESDGIVLYHGDMRDIVPSLAYNCIVTDPPYGETALAWDRWVDGWPGLLLTSTIERQLWCFGSMRMFLSKVGEVRARYRLGKTQRVGVPRGPVQAGA